MIKTAFFKDEIVDVFKYLDSKTPILEDFAEDIKDLNELTPLLHIKKNISTEENVLNYADKELKKTFIDIYNRYFRKLTPKYRLETPIKDKKRVKKIFIVGSPKTGKKTLLKNIELIQFLNVRNNDLPTRIYEVIIENLEILNFDQVNCDFGCKAFDSFEDCLQHSQGLILVLKLSDENSILETKNMYQVIEDKFLELEIASVPVLIIGNKFSHDDDEKKELIHKTFEIENLKEEGRKIRYFPVKVLEEDKKVMKALRWMIKNIL